MENPANSSSDQALDKYDNRGIQATVYIGIITAVLLTVLFITAPLLYFAALDVEQNGQQTTETALKGLSIIIEKQQDEAMNYAAAIALNSDVKRFIITRNRNGIVDLLSPLLKQSHLDAITITDNKGIVIARVHAPTLFGDSVINQFSVESALTGIPAKAIETGTVVKMGMRAGTPIMDERGIIIGAVSTAYCLDKNEIVDQVKNVFKTDATIFLGDVRVATTITDQGQRVIGTRLDEKIANIVLQQNKQYVGRATILGKEYITAYKPVAGPNGKVAAILFAGKDLAAYNHERIRTVFIIAAVLILAIFISAGIAITLGRKISKPVIKSVKLLRESEEQFRQMFTKQQAIMWLVDPISLRIINANEAAKNFFGYTDDEIKQFRIVDLIAVSDETVKITHSNLRKSPSQLLEAKARLANGQIRDIEIRKTLISLETKEFFFDIINDITERKQAEEGFRHLVFHDSLTNLFNRAYFEQELQNSEKNLGSPVGIIICDLDGLKIINDTLGHEYGDQMLSNAAAIIRNCCDKPHVVARIGGDEFAIVLKNVPESVIETTCEKIRQGILDYNKTIQDYPISLSIGYAYGTEPESSVRELYKEADNKMYREKLHRSQSARSAIVQTVMKLLQARDFITEGHADRLKDIVSSLGHAIGLTEGRIADLKLLAQFHDIGKVGVPDSILLKPSALNPEEMLEMRRHCEIGHRIAIASADLTPIADWILKHHEWWNGSGYPLNLAGEDIPLECRILSIADAYDAMTSDRPYRKAMNHEDAIIEIRRCAGTQFDPKLVEKFCEIDW